VRAIGVDVGGTLTDPRALGRRARRAGRLQTASVPQDPVVGSMWITGCNSETQLGPIGHRLGYRFKAAARRSANSSIVRLGTDWAPMRR